MCCHQRRKAFTLIEVLIVVVIMAVLAATIIPQFSSSTKDAKESSLNFNLHTMRSQIELFKAHHLGTPPASLDLMTKATDTEGNPSSDGTPDDTHPYGPYFEEIPANPYNGKATVNDVGTGGITDGSGTYGWQYDSSTGRLAPDNTEWKVPTT